MSLDLRLSKGRPQAAGRTLRQAQRERRIPLAGNSSAAQAVLPREMEDERSAAARRLASLRRVYKKTCPVCGSEFAGIAKRVYDTHACQVKAYRSRRKQRETAAN